MATDGKVTIEVDLSTNHVQSDADQIEKILNDIDIPTIKVKADGSNAEEEISDLKKDLDKVPEKKKPPLTPTVRKQHMKLKRLKPRLTKSRIRRLPATKPTLRVLSNISVYLADHSRKRKARLPVLQAL